MTTDQISEAVRRVLGDHAKLAVDVASLTDDADLYEAGMTSFNSVNVMLALEESFDVEFPDVLLTRDAFASVDAITAALRTLITAPA